MGGEVVRTSIGSTLIRPYLYWIAAGIILQTIAWVGQFRHLELRAIWLWMATVGIVLTILATIIVRESIRLAAVDPEMYATAHAEAAKTGGFTAFLIVLGINTVVIVACVRLTVRGVRKNHED